MFYLYIFQVTERFGDPLFPQQLDSFQLEGMPEHRDHTLLYELQPSDLEVGIKIMTIIYNYGVFTGIHMLCRS